MKKYIDLHAHPFKEYFESPNQIIEESHKEGVSKIFLVGTSLDDSKELKETSSKYNYTFPIIGIHPNNSTNKSDLVELKKMMDESIVGIGEIGFDFHYDDSPSKQEQEFFFRYQIELALEYQVPVIIHCRDSTKEIFDVLKEYKDKNKDFKIIIHSYSSGPDWVKKFLDLGAFLSFSGIVTFKNAKDVQEAALLTPIERLFYETDTPYLSPVPLRGKVNKPSHVIHTANFIAKLKNISVEKLNKQVNKNLEFMFNLKEEKNE